MAKLKRNDRNHLKFFNESALVATLKANRSKIGRVMAERMVETSNLTLAEEFLADWSVGSVVATTQRCVENICSEINWDQAREIAELGPGNGVFTAHILKNIDAKSKIVCVEKNEHLAQKLCENMVDDRLQCVNQDAIEFMQKRAVSSQRKLDYIVCGIPLSFINKTDRIQFINSCFKCLSQKGCFILYQSIFTISNYRFLLKAQPNYNAAKLKVFWKNLPPLWVATLSK